MLCCCVLLRLTLNHLSNRERYTSHKHKLWIISWKFESIWNKPLNSARNLVYKMYLPF